MDRDYGKIKRVLSRDPVVDKAVKFGWGIRILNQDPWETLISFIISANNNISRIKKIIKNLSRRYGSSLIWNGSEFFRFLPLMLWPMHPSMIPWIADAVTGRGISRKRPE